MDSNQNPEVSEVEDPTVTCECCQLLREHATPVVDYLNISKSDVIYDRTLHIYKLESLTTSSKKAPEASQNPGPSSSFSVYPQVAPAKIKRQLDRFEESRLWDLIGLTPKMYEKLPAELKKVTKNRLVFKKCIYRLHNTRHFQVPLVKRGGIRKEDVLKQNYEDDRKLLKKNQAYPCPWDDCPHSFQDPQDMRIHYMFDHESVKLFCCGNRFENYDSFLEHYTQTLNGTGHATWMARECWGCGIRHVDAVTFYQHAERCGCQIHPFACPDPLCGIRFEYLVDVIDHFFIWHDKAGSIVCNDAVYSTRESIEEDLQLFDDGQLVVNYPLKAMYKCGLCNIQFAADQHYREHVATHIENPHLWLVPTILYCVKCNRKNCRFQRTRLIELIPKLIQVTKHIKVEKCEKNPILLIWRLFLTQEYTEILQMVYMKLVAEQRRLAFAEEFLDESEHPECDERRLAYVLNSLCFLYTVPYKSDKEILEEKKEVIAKIMAEDEEINVVE